jgi:uncharacterized membrane protein YfcA
MILDWTQLLVINLALIVGSALQGAIGYGMGLLVTPLLLLVDPRLIPGPFLLAATLEMVLMNLRERQALDLFGLRWALVGGVPGIVAGTLLLSVLPQTQFNLAFGVIILLAVLMSLGGLRFPMRKSTLVIAGILSGIMGSMGAIGGPPLALVYQDSSPQRLRATISGYFIVAGIITLASLGFAGQFDADGLQLTLVQLPGILFGFLLSSLLVKRLRGASLRPYVLGISFAAGIIVIIKQIIG